MSLRPPHPNGANHDEPEDAYLRAALRHAPDANVAPPATLSAAILSQARAAASITQASTMAEPLAPVWQLLAWLRQGWLALSQPALAAGVASVMVASVVGVMWWDRVPDDVSAHHELSREKSTSSAPPNQTLEAAKAATQDSVAAPASRAPNAPLVVADAHKPAAAKAPPAAAHEQAPARVTSKATEQRRAVADAIPQDKEVALDTQAQANTQPHPQRGEPTPVAAPAPLPETTRLRERADAPTPAVAAAEQTQARPGPPLAPAPTTPLAKVVPPLAAPAPAPPPAAAPAVAAAAAPTPASKVFSLERESARTSGLALGFAASTPVTSLREALRDEPERWAWQKNVGAFAPVVPEVAHWLAQLESATAGRWVPQLDLRASGAAQTLLTLRWIRDGQTVHTLVLRADGLSWQKAGAAEPAWFAPLDAGMVKRLTDALP
jgi:hypothetical protein